jgi:hypothetical protein
MAIKTFTTGEVLTAADTNTYLANSGLVFVKSQTIGSAVSTVTVSSAFSADYDNYLVKITGGVGSSSNAQLNLTLGSTATGYEYGYGYFGNGSSGGIGSTTATFISVGEINTNILQGTFEINNKSCQIHLLFRHFGMTNGNRVGRSFDTTQYTAFTLTQCRNFTGGTITVYGYRKG